MKRFLVLAILLGICGSRGAEMKTGKERLRELVVVPTMEFNFGFHLSGSVDEFLEEHLVPSEVSRLRTETREHPGDAKSLMQLAAVLGRDGQTNELPALISQAEKAARKKSEARPQDGLALVILADVLHSQGKEVEAESVYRKATLVSSNEWKCWLSLGDFLAHQALTGIMPVGNVPLLASAKSLATIIGDYRPASEKLRKSEALRKESEQCFDRALSLAPKEVDVNLGFAAVQMGFGLTDFLVRFYRGQTSLDTNEQPGMLYVEPTIQYMRQAVALRPDDDRIIAAAAWYEEMSAMVKFKQKNPNQEFAFAALPDKVQADIHAAMDRLESLSKRPDTERASGASENLGGLKIMIGDFAGAQAPLRWAISLRPERQRAWEMLLAAMVTSGASPEDLATLCQSLLKNKNSSRNHLLLAKALLKEKKFDEALVQVRDAWSLDSNNVTAGMFAFALMLKSTKTETLISIGPAALGEVQKLVEDMPPTQEKRTRWRECMLDGAILNALLDRPTEAKDWVKSVQEQFPDDQDARGILSAIN